MTSRLDDALIHQNYGTLVNVVDDDPRWFDRFYFNMQAVDGSMATLRDGTKVAIVGWTQSPQIPSAG